MKKTRTQRYIVKNKKNQYLTPRRKVKGQMYTNRVTWSDNLDDANIFQTPQAAKNSANQSGEKDTKVETVLVHIQSDTSLSDIYDRNFFSI